MKKTVTVFVWIFFFLTILSAFYLVIDTGKGKYVLLFNLSFLLIFFLTNIINKKITLKKIIIKCLVFIGLMIISFLSGVYYFVSTEKVCESTEPERNNSWKNIKPINIIDIQNQLFLISDKLDISVLSTIYFQKDTFNIYSIKINPNKEKKLLLIAGIHGSEPAGVSAIPKIVNEIVTNFDKYKDWNMEIIYPLNPVGIKLFSRLNESGCNINRDFKLFKTPQASLIKELFLKNKYDIVLDLHEGPYQGHAILTNNVIDYALIKELDKYLQANNIKQSHLTSGTSNSLMTFIQFYKYDSFLSRFGETKMLFRFADDCGIEYITSESDGYSEDYEMRVNCHYLMFKGIMSYQTIKK
jgi:hypothetical protein